MNRFFNNNVISVLYYNKQSMQKQKQYKRKAKEQKTKQEKLFYDINCQNQLPQDYKFYFQKEEQSIDKHIEKCLKNQEKCKDLKIKNLKNYKDFDYKLAYDHSPVKKIKQQLDGSIFYFAIMQSGFLIQVNMLNLKRKSPKYCDKYYGNGFSDTYFSTELDLFVRRIPFKSSTKILENGQWVITPNKVQIEYVVRLIAIYKLCNLFDIGPSFPNILGFEIICYEDCCQFFIEKTKPIQYLARKFQSEIFESRLRFCVRLLHKLNLTYNFFQTRNIVFSENIDNYVLDNFELVTMRNQINDLDVFEIQDQIIEKIKVNVKYGIMADLQTLQQIIAKLRKRSMDIQEQLIFISQFDMKSIDFYQEIKYLFDLLQQRKSNNIQQAIKDYKKLNDENIDSDQIRCQFLIRIYGTTEMTLSELKYENIKNERVMKYVNKIINDKVNQEDQLVQKKEEKNNMNIFLVNKFQYWNQKILTSTQQFTFDKIMFVIDNLLYINFIKYCQRIKKLLFILNCNYQTNIKIIRDTIKIVNALLVPAQIDQIPQIPARLVLLLNILYKEQKYSIIINIYERFNISVDQNVSLLNIIMNTYLHNNHNPEKCLEILQKPIIKKYPLYRQLNSIYLCYILYKSQTYYNMSDQLQKQERLRQKIKHHFSQINMILVNDKIQKRLNFFIDKFIITIKFSFNLCEIESVIKLYNSIKVTTFHLPPTIYKIIQCSILKNQQNYFKQYVSKFNQECSEIYNQTYEKGALLYQIGMLVMSIKKQSFNQFLQEGRLTLQNLCGKNSAVLIKLGIYFLNRDLLRKNFQKVKNDIDSNLVLLQKLKGVQNLKIKLHYLNVFCYYCNGSTQLEGKVVQFMNLMNMSKIKEILYLRYSLKIGQIYKNIKKSQSALLLSFNLIKVIENLKLKNNYCAFINLENIAVAYYQMNQFQKSLRICEEIIERFPFYHYNNYLFLTFRIFGLLGCIYYQRKNLEKAIYCLQNAIEYRKMYECKTLRKYENFSRYKIYLANLGICYYKKKQYMHSIYILLQFQKPPINEDIIIIICRVLKFLKKFRLLQKVLLDNIHYFCKQSKQITQKSKSEQRNIVLGYQCLNLAQHYNSRKQYIPSYILLKKFKKIKSQTEQKFKEETHKKLTKKLQKSLGSLYFILGNLQESTKNINTSGQKLKMLKILKLIKFQELKMLLTKKSKSKNSKLIKQLQINLQLQTNL